MDLTKKQRAVYEFLKDYRREHGMPPSYEEIRQQFGFASLNSARKHLLQLHRKGYIKSPWKNQKRALEIVPREEEAAPSAMLPLLGMVVAGHPIESVETPDSVAVPESLLGRGDHFALRVSGDSMIEDGILDGDLLVVQSRDSADVGQTVVALVDGEATVKRFYRQGDRIELRPANPRFQPILADPESVRLRGVVVGLVRKLD